MRSKYRLNFDRAMAYSVTADKRNLLFLFLWAQRNWWANTHLVIKRYCVS